MIKFKYLLLASLFVACSGSSGGNNLDEKVCPQCNMSLPKNNKYTAYIKENNHFDDIGCLILWSQNNRMDLNSRDIFVFSNDTNRYIDAKSARYSFNEKTPMNYGFVAYENRKENTISFDEMRLRMVRGEHLANPKIRKKILGY